MDPAKLVFLDEAGMNIGITRLSALYEAIKDALDLISLSDIKGWFPDANYSVAF